MQRPYGVNVAARTLVIRQIPDPVSHSRWLPPRLNIFCAELIVIDLLPTDNRACDTHPVVPPIGIRKSTVAETQSCAGEGGRHTGIGREGWTGSVQRADDFGVPICHPRDTMGRHHMIAYRHQSLQIARSLRSHGLNQRRPDPEWS